MKPYGLFLTEFIRKKELIPYKFGRAPWTLLPSIQFYTNIREGTQKFQESLKK